MRKRGQRRNKRSEFPDALNSLSRLRSSKRLLKQSIKPANRLSDDVPCSTHIRQAAALEPGERGEACVELAWPHRWQIESFSRSPLPLRGRDKSLSRPPTRAPSRRAFRKLIWGTPSGLV